MRKLLFSSILVLVLAGLVSAPATLAEVNAGMTVEVEAGTSDFELKGEHFRIISTQDLRIIFQGITTARVRGIIIPSDPLSGDSVEFVWYSQEFDALILYDGIMMEQSCPFDSEDVSGHNEK